MSFKENAYQQISFTDSFSGLTAREQKALEKSWAKVFADERTKQLLTDEDKLLSLCESDYNVENSVASSFSVPKWQR